MQRGSRWKDERKESERKRATRAARVGVESQVG